MNFQQYEFSNSQNELIKQLADKMRFVSYFAIVFGVLSCAVGGLTVFRGGLGNIVAGVVFTFIGSWTYKAASSFNRIVDTEGNDIENLMGALGELRKLYVLQYWLLVVTIIFVVIGIVMGIAFYGLSSVL